MTHLKQAAHILINMLREVFDEAAYDRFLERTQMASSPSAYAAFWHERENKAPKPRCC